MKIKLFVVFWDDIILLHLFNLGGGKAVVPRTRTGYMPELLLTIRLFLVREAPKGQRIGVAFGCPRMTTWASHHGMSEM